MITKHILKTDFNVTAELELNEQTGQFNCVWEGLPEKVNQALRDQILSAYIPWRDEILSSWAKRAGKKVLVINV